MTDQHTEQRAAARSMALLSTLSTAVELVNTMRERRLGRDPSEQQSRDVVLPSLASDVSRLEHHIVALRSSLVAAERESSERVVLVRHLSDLILLGGLSRDLHGLHQRLMSLYPSVDEELVEAARRLQRASGELIEQEDIVPDGIIRFIEDAVELLACMRIAVALKGPFDRTNPPNI